MRLCIATACMRTLLINSSSTAIMLSAGTRLKRLLLGYANAAESDQCSNLRITVCPVACACFLLAARW
jgi:hypothetical protein